MRRFFNKNVEKVLRQTKGISTRLAAGPPLTDFDEAAFTALVSRVKISSTAITFGLINGMNLPEGRRSKMYAGYSMPTPQGKHFNRLPMRCLPKVSPTVRMHLAGTKTW